MWNYFGLIDLNDEVFINDVYEVPKRCVESSDLCDSYNIRIVVFNFCMIVLVVCYVKCPTTWSKGRDHNSVTGCWKMTMMYSNIMLGRLPIVIPIFFLNESCFINKTTLIITKVQCHTRHRKKPALGTRYLKDPDRVFEFNAWDNVKWDAEQEEEAKRKVTENSSVIADESERKKYDTDAAQYWDSFYNIHQNRFFKDRHWLFTEFPELVPETLNPKLPVSVHYTDSQLKSDTFGEEVKQKTEREETVLLSNNVEQLSIEEQSSKPWTILEIGCGVGNTVFPILQLNKDVNLFVYCCDLSSKAVQILKENPEYDTKRCHAFEYDITSRNEEPPFPPKSLDVAVLIFILSAINPEKMQLVVDWIFQYLRPGGIVIFRDYGRYDMAQIRFKKGRCLSGNFYARGDGTQVYFFAQDDVKTLFKNAGFIEEQNVIDRRLQVNRGKQLKMYRVWIQAKYRKPH